VSLQTGVTIGWQRLKSKINICSKLKVIHFTETCKLKESEQESFANVIHDAPTYLDCSTPCATSQHDTGESAAAPPSLLFVGVEFQLELVEAGHR